MTMQKLSDTLQVSQPHRVTPADAKKKMMHNKDLGQYRQKVDLSLKDKEDFALFV